MTLKTFSKDNLFELKQVLPRWVRWFKIRRTLNWGIRGLVLGLFGALIFSSLAVLSGRLLRNEFLQLSLMISSAGFLFGIIFGFGVPFPTLKAARFFDKTFQLKERMSTAFELAEQNTAVHPALIAKQAEDAVRHARMVNLYQDFPLRFPSREFLISLILVLSLFFIWMEGDTYFEAAQQRELAKDAIKQEAQNIEALINDLKNDPSLSEPQKETLTEPLDDALNQLGESENLEGAVSALTETEEKLQSLSDRHVETESQALQSLGNRLRQDQNSPLQQFGENLSEENYSAAADELQNLDVENLSESAGEILAQQLEQSAEALEETSPDLAQDLRETAEELRNGNNTEAQSSLQQAAQSLQQTAQEVVQSEAAKQSVEQLRDSQRRLVETGRYLQNQNGENKRTETELSSQQGQLSQNSQTGQGNQTSSSQEGQTPGEGPTGTGQNQDSSGTGTGEGSSDGSNIQGSEVSGSSISQENAPSDGGQRGYEPIYSPQLLGGEGGAEIALPGEDGSGDLVVGEGDSSPETPEIGKVPYADVFQLYDQAARKAIENGQIPIHLKSLIRDYFSSLEP